MITKSSVNKIIGFEGEVLKVKCCVAPEKGKANEVVISLLSKYYKIPKSHIRIIRGEKSSRKTIEIKKL